MNPDDELINDLLIVAAEDADTEIDRAVLKDKLLAEFGRVRKKVVEPAMLNHRLDQIGNLAERLVIEFDETLQLKVEPHPRDWLGFQLLRFGCEWHEPMDVESVVRQCLPSR